MLFEPPRVDVDTGDGGPPRWPHVLAALGICWVLTLGAIHVVTPTLAQAIALSASDDVLAAQTASFALDLLLDSLFVGVGAYWAIQLSRLRALPSALLFGVTLLGAHVLEAGGLPGTIETGLPLWYDLVGNVNDIAGALAAAMLHAWWHD